MYCETMSNSVGELKETIRVYLALSGGDANGLLTSTLKVVDALDAVCRSDKEEAVLDIMAAAYTPMFVLASGVQERLEMAAPAYPDNQGLANQIATGTAVIAKYTQNQPVTVPELTIAKSNLMNFVSTAILELSNATGDTYPDIPSIIGAKC